jgi:hypothetical protein
MSDEHRPFVEKYGLIGAATTAAAILLAVIIQLVIISKWTGAIEEQARAMCLRITVLESFKETAAFNYVTRHEHEDLKGFIERLTKNRDASDARLEAAIGRLDAKFDEHIKEFRQGKR